MLLLHRVTVAGQSRVGILIDWDPDTSRSRASKRGEPIHRRSITLTLVLFVSAMIGAWFFLSRDGEPRNVNSLDISALQMDTISAAENSGMHILRGSAGGSGYTWVVSILYSETLSGNEIIDTEQFAIENDWLALRHGIDVREMPYRTVRNSAVVCFRTDGCDYVADRLELYTE